MTHPNPVISFKRYESSPDSLRELIRLCGGFDRLRPSYRAFIKPNLVAFDDRYPMPLYGVFSTTRLVHDMVFLLKEFGINHISIGEGSFRGKDFAVSTMGIFKALGYPRLEKRYGVKLVDLLEGPFQAVDFGEFRLEVAQPILETDFLINMPVLKTHNQAVLSLGFKNLKGCLSVKSRKFCHGRSGSLHHHLSLLVEKITPALTILDGIYGLEKGPFYLGRAVAMQAMAASKDPLALDLAGAALAGIDPANVPHIREYAHRHRRSLDLNRYVTQGTPLQELQQTLKWDNHWNEQNTGPKAWEKLGIRGVFLPKYDETVCTGCSGLYGTILTMIMASYTAPLNDIEILTGKRMKPSGKANKTMLLGNCMIKENRKDPAVKDTVIVKGCPPSLRSVLDGLERCGIHIREDIYAAFRQTLVDRYKGKEGFDESFYYIGASS
ncbi:MAG: DUF362 domain-containing protein [Deltaproteobacteria bacterium]|nr:DUF362 domain-containing protein [Deltaproteobacteria bacterium]